LIKSGPGILEFTATNSYSGNTTNLAGTLLVNGMLGGDSLTIASGTLGGTGTITAPVIVQAGATLSPGASVGTLTISNTLLLSGTASFELNKSVLTNDLIQGLARVTYGGTLTVTNLGGTLAAGDTFKLFDAAIYDGAFTNIVPATP